MKISENWLREWVNPPVDSAALAGQLTMAGLEVESAHPCTWEWRGIIAGRIREVSAHPGQSGLSVCQVETGAAGGQILNIVCGAPGLAAGGCHPLAPPGAELPGGRRVEARDVHGVRSEGMLCSRAELGLGDDAARLMVLDAGTAPGTPLEQVLELTDRILEIALTPNRGDCFSVRGIARETAVANHLSFTEPGFEPVADSGAGQREIRLEAPRGCPRYVGRVIEGIDMSVAVPVWIGERLRRADIRLVNAVVDITNYVMLELGQPMHAFDNDRLEGAVCARQAIAGEALELLDGRQLTLQGDTLVIADGRGAVALAGIMGGMATAMRPDSRNLFLESAFFAPGSVQGRARRHGLQTDASQRFERGVDYTIQRRAMDRATALILACCGGKPGPVVDATSPEHLPRPAPVTLRATRLERLLGAGIPEEAPGDILRRLGFTVQSRNGTWESLAPPFRFDIALEADLAEEVARVYGYDRIPGQSLGGRVRMHADNGAGRPQGWRRLLTARGYSEAITYSFVDAGLQQRLLGPQPAIALRNPISADMNVMRRSLWPGLFQALKHNLNRQQIRVRLFEIGRIFEPGPQPVQTLTIGGIVHGNIYPEQWDIKYSESDFYDMKNDVEALLAITGPGQAALFRGAAHPACHPRQFVEIVIKDQVVGKMGAIHPRILGELDVPGSVLAFELNLEELSIHDSLKLEEIPRFPSVRRDISLVLARETPFEALKTAVSEAGKPLLHNLELFDVYEGEGIDSGKKSLALGLTFQKSSSTLIDAEVEAVLARILATVQGQFGAKLRD